jgi:hypothetical protein
MYDPAVPEELDSAEQDLPPEVEVFFEPPAQPPDTEFLGDVTQLYLNEIWRLRGACARAISPPARP